MRLTVIGCTGSFPGPNAAASCYMVSTIDDLGKTWRIIVDMGNGALGTLQSHINLEDIDAILISHLHPDHCIDLSGLHVAVKWNPNGWSKGPIPLYGPSDIHQYLVNTHGLPIEPGFIFSPGRLTTRCAPVSVIHHVSWILTPSSFHAQ